MSVADVLQGAKIQFGAVAVGEATRSVKPGALAGIVAKSGVFVYGVGNVSRERVVRG